MTPPSTTDAPMEATRSLRIDPALWDAYGRVVRAEGRTRGSDLRLYMEQRVREAAAT